MGQNFVTRFDATYLSKNLKFFIYDALKYRLLLRFGSLTNVIMHQKSQYTMRKTNGELEIKRKDNWLLVA